MTSRAKDMALTTVVSPDTAPHFMVLPSMIAASISTVPLVVSTEPLPALKCGQYSNSRTYTEQISRAYYKVKRGGGQCSHLSNKNSVAITFSSIRLNKHSSSYFCIKRLNRYNSGYKFYIANVYLSHTGGDKARIHFSRFFQSD